MSCHVMSCQFCPPYPRHVPSVVLSGGNSQQRRVSTRRVRVPFGELQRVFLPESRLAADPDAHLVPVAPEFRPAAALTLPPLLAFPSAVTGGFGAIQPRCARRDGWNLILNESCSKSHLTSSCAQRSRGCMARQSECVARIQFLTLKSPQSGHMTRN